MNLYLVPPEHVKTITCRMCPKCLRLMATCDTAPCVCDGGPERTFPTLDGVFNDVFKKIRARVERAWEEALKEPDSTRRKSALTSIDT